MCWCWPSHRSRNSLPHRNRDCNTLPPRGQILPEARVLFLMGPFWRIGLLKNWKFKYLLPRKKTKSLSTKMWDNRGPTTYQLKLGKPILHWAVLASSVKSDSGTGCFPVPSSLVILLRWEKGVGWIGLEEKERWIRNYFIFHKHLLQEQPIKAYQTLINIVLSILWLEDISFLKWGLLRQVAA